MKYYRGDWKYRLAEPLIYETKIHSDGAKLPFCSITQKGKLQIKRGYSWDGASGPAIDTKTIIRGSCVHDALYQLLRETTVFGSAKYHDDRRASADQILHSICLADGMWKVRAWWVYHAVRRAGGPAAALKKRKVYEINDC